MKSINTTKNNTEQGFQGRRPKQVESNNRIGWIGVVMLASIIFLIVVANRCGAQETGYRWCISDSAGFRCDNTTQLQVALDSIIPFCNTPGSVIAACLENSRYYLLETEVFTVYVEEKKITGYKKNGQPKLRKLKRQK